MYNADVMTALGNSCSKLLQGIGAVLQRSRASSSSPTAGPAAAAASDSAAGATALQMELLPVLFVLFQVSYALGGC